MAEEGSLACLLCEECSAPVFEHILEKHMNELFRFAGDI